jgi:hypothetical protein
VILLKLVLASSLSFGAEVQIVDQSNVLERVRGEVEFSEAFACPATAYVHSSVSIAQVNCGANSCTAQIGNVNSKSSVFVEECTSQGVKVYGDQGLEFTITKAEYDKGGKSWVIPFLKQSYQFFGAPPAKVILEHSFPTMIDFIQNGNKQTMFVDMIHIAYQFQPNTMTYGMTLYVNPLAKGLDQILLLKTINDTIYRRKGVFGEKF